MSSSTYPSDFSCHKLSHCYYKSVNRQRISYLKHMRKLFKQYVKSHRTIKGVVSAIDRMDIYKSDGRNCETLSVEYASALWESIVTYSYVDGAGEVYIYQFKVASLKEINKDFSTDEVTLIGNIAFVGKNEGKKVMVGVKKLSFFDNFRGIDLYKLITDAFLRKNGILVEKCH